ncbi:MAG: IS4 family transposase, partial [Candidatus Latescibacteria bacterium]|nr:IS4 family transposase [Candidatus Latescibacterota bacterium]
MVRQASLFSQLLRQVPRDVFEQLVREHQAEKGAKGLTCWTQLVAMLFCHLGRADSLREICNGLACCVGKLVHVGIGRAPKRSWLSYANAHRPAVLFEDLFWKLAIRLRNREGLGQRKSKFRFKNKLLSLDSTTISLCLSLFPWARFRRAKGGVKVHVLLDHDDYMPSYVLLTEARRHDRTGARLVNLNPGSIVAMDRAYNDYQLFADWTTKGIHFVTRPKANADYYVKQHRRVPSKSPIRADQVIRLMGVTAEKK